MNDDVRVAIITGAGDRAFTSGIDLTFDYPQPTSKLMINDDLRYVGPKTNDLWKPVIAAVNGLACGAAFFLLGEVEMIIAAESATFFDPHLTHGMPTVAEPMFMLQRMPLGEIMRISLLGRHERMTAQHAHQIGLVQEIVPADQLMDSAMSAARVIAGMPEPTAVEATVKAIWTAQYMAIHQALQAAPSLIQLAQGEHAMAQDTPTRSVSRRSSRACAESRLALAVPSQERRDVAPGVASPAVAETGSEEFSARIAQAYATEGAAVSLGRGMLDGSVAQGAVVQVPASMCNRHGLIAGATGTGKTKTLQLMAEQLSAIGVPVFAADIKGDLSGLLQPGEANDRVTARVARSSVSSGRRAGNPGELPRRSAASGPGCPCAPRCRRSGRSSSPRCSARTRRRRRRCRWCSTTPTRPACRWSTSTTCARCCSTSPATTARPSSRASADCRPRPPACCSARSSSSTSRAPRRSSASPSSTPPT